MSTSLTIQDWLEPVQGQMSQRAWHQLAYLGESVLLTAAMQCARRGDAESLAALFEHFNDEDADPGTVPGPWMTQDVRVDVTLEIPQYERVSVTEWEDHADMRLPMTTHCWQRSSFEGAVALCLSRSRREDGSVVMPRSLDEDLGKAIPFTKPALLPAERRLLAAAIDVYQGIPANSSATGIQRLFFEVAARVPCAEVVRAFEERGFKADELTSVQLYASRNLDNMRVAVYRHAVMYGNVIGAGAISDWCERSGAGIEPQERALALQGSHGSHDAGTIIEAVRDDVGPDGRIGHDPRFVLLMREVASLMQEVCVRERVLNTLFLVARHLETANRFNRAWSEEVVQGFVQAAELQALPAADVAPGIQAAASNNSTQVFNWMRQLLAAQCAPMLQALQPWLRELMDQAKTYGGGNLIAGALSKTLAWSGVDGPQRLGQTAELLQAQGFDVLGVMNTSAFDDEKRFTTLLHEVAAVPRSGHVQAMVALLELGADPQALDDQGRVPGQRLDDPALREAWERAWRSHQARECARGALDDVLQASPSREVAP